MKSYFRYLGRNRLYTAVNVIGFGVSLMFAILIGDYVWRQLSMDAWHKNRERVYLLADDDSFKSWPAITKGMELTFPEIEKTCLLQSQSGTVTSEYGEYTSLNKQYILLADSDFFDFFDFKLIEGDRRTALDSPEKVLLTRSLADILFPDGNPVGKSIRIDGSSSIYLNDERPHDPTLTYTVSGIVEDLDNTVLPSETSLIASIDRYPQIMGYTLVPNAFAKGPGGDLKSYIMTGKGVDVPALEKQLTEYVKEHVSFYRYMFRDVHIHMIPQSKVAFAQQNDGTATQKGDYGRIMILLASVIALLFFAISNYINLTVAGAVARVKEMATRRLLGSSKTEILFKFIMESVFIVGVSFILGLLMAFAFEDEFATLFSGKIDLAHDINLATVSICVAFVLLAGCIAGIIPSVQISRFSSVDVTKGAYRRHSNNILSKVFIILQNTITVILLTASFVIWLQIHHMVSAPLGFETKDRFAVYTFDDKDVVLSKLQELPGIVGIGFMTGSDFLGNGSSSSTLRLPDGIGVEVYQMEMNDKALDILGLKVIRRNADAQDGYYVTEKFLELVGVDSNAESVTWEQGRKTMITAVVQNFHVRNILSEPLPFMIRVNDFDDYPYTPKLIVQTDGSKESRAALMAFAENEYVMWGNTYKYDVQSFEDVVEASFKEDRRTLKIVELFALMAVIISILGFVGMSLFFIRQRKKEIGIRKIAGGDSAEVGVLMMRIFCTPLLFSFVIAIPLSWYIMNDWLSGFAYRMELHWWIFAATCATSLLIAVMSVLSQIFYAVRQNPVDSIKSE